MASFTHGITPAFLNKDRHCQSQCKGEGQYWYHAIFDIGGQLGLSSYVKVNRKIYTIVY